MAIRKIRTVEDEILRKPTRLVTKFDDRLAELAGDMIETMDDANGVGIAAPQVGVLRRIAIAQILRCEGCEECEDNCDDEELGDEELADEDYEPERSTPEDTACAKPLVLVNPMIIHKEGEQDSLEGCLSIPGRSGWVKRPEKVVAEYQDLKGEFHTIEEDGFFATVLCHEIDHLDGVLYIDKMYKEVFRPDDDSRTMTSGS